MKGKGGCWLSGLIESNRLMERRDGRKDVPLLRLCRDIHMMGLQTKHDDRRLLDFSFMFWFDGTQDVRFS